MCVNTQQKERVKSQIHLQHKKRCVNTEVPTGIFSSFFTHQLSHSVVMTVGKLLKAGEEFSIRWTDPNPQKSSLTWCPAFVSERVKGFWSAVGVEWRMGLLCAPLLSRGPQGHGSVGKGFVMSQACSACAALLFPLPAHTPFHCTRLSVALSSPFVQRKASLSCE